jgi:23S rRNA (guanine745-N1)-methyltransferase
VRRPTLRSRFDLFRCPVCALDLELVERRLVCAKGHSFDLARSGYVNLATARKHVPAAGGDTRLQLEHRAHFLGRGHFNVIADAIASHVGETDAALDTGCGTGFHLARLVERTGAVDGAGIDLSKEAADWCARHHTGLAFAVADIWDRWPVRSRSVGLVTSIFAPKNYSEAARVLRRAGVFALVFPGPRHLQELRDAFGLLGVAQRKTEDYRTRLAPHFDEIVLHKVVRRTAFDQADIEHAILMGPSARHLQRLPQVPHALEVTLDIEFLIGRRRVG